MQTNDIHKPESLKENGPAIFFREEHIIIILKEYQVEQENIEILYNLPDITK